MVHCLGGSSASAQRDNVHFSAVRSLRTYSDLMHPHLDICTVRTDAVSKYEGRGFGDRSLIGPLDVPDAERCFVLLLPVECNALAALPVPGALLVGAVAVLGDETVVAHEE